MRLLINHLLTPIFYFCFGGILVLFHPFQVFLYYTFGDRAHRNFVYFLNACLSSTLYILGHSVKFVNKQNLPKDRPLIIVANHNSLHDIPTLYAKMSAFNPIFVSKLELSKSIPSVSFNLRKSGAALIDRSDRMQSLKEILRLGSFIKENNYSAVIFPEGTRSGTDLKPFKPGGVAALLKRAPNALVIPVAIEGTMKINMHKKYPLNTFRKLKWTVLPPLDPNAFDIEELLQKARLSIADELGLNK